MGLTMVMTGAMMAALAQQPLVIDVTNGPVATTTVAVKVSLDGAGRVVSCRTASGVGGACAGFPKGRVVSAPIRRNGQPVAATMTVSTTTVVSGD